jgi:hypothetical protein
MIYVTALPVPVFHRLEHASFTISRNARFSLFLGGVVDFCTTWPTVGATLQVSRS